MSDLPRKRKRASAPTEGQKENPEYHTTRTENVRKTINEVARLRQDIVWERLNHVDHTKFVYHVNNT